MRAPRMLLLSGTVLLVVGSALPTDAQVIEHPPRAFRGLFDGELPINPALTNQAATLRASAMGGYDQNVAPPGTDPTQLGFTEQGTLTSFADATLRYWRGGVTRSMDVDARGYTNAYGADSGGPSFGTSVRFAGTAALGRHDQLSVVEDVRFEPYLTLGGFGALRSSLGADALPAASPVQGLSNTRSFANISSAALNHRWSPRTSSSADYEFNKRNYIDSGGFDSRSQAARFTSSYLITRRVSLRGSYRYSNSDYFDPQAVSSLDDHNIEGGFSYDRAFSASRHWSIGAAGGATRVATLDGVTRAPIDYWAPSLSGTVHLDMGRSWNMSTDYRRGATVLQTATLDSFFTDAVAVRAGGLVGDRTDLTVIGAYTNGKQSGGEGHYGSYLATGQVRFAMSHWGALVLNYSRYFYTLERIKLTDDFPPSFSRNAVRAGFDLSLPLSGLPRTKRKKTVGEAG